MNYITGLYIIGFILIGIVILRLDWHRSRINEIYKRANAEEKFDKENHNL